MQAVEALLTLPCLKERWAGNDEAVKNNLVELYRLFKMNLFLFFWSGVMLWMIFPGT
ncbi:hypothetical protein [Endozoicomonas sp. ALB091]|uniref:hypothetical protein n=1 Tax=Endozoicomonas sp. ALB091 TaxID=3403073 RepID=UPI003BB57545